MPDKTFQKDRAREALTRAGIPLGAGFHTLSNSQVDALLDEADHVHYRKPKAANGSRARYFHALLQRRAAYVLGSGAGEWVTHSKPLR